MMTPQQKIDRLKKAGYQVQEKGNKIRAAKGSLIINGTITKYTKKFLTDNYIDSKKESRHTSLLDIWCI